MRAAAGCRPNILVAHITTKLGETRVSATSLAHHANTPSRNPFNAEGAP